jgi:hypothetical protein
MSIRTALCSSTLLLAVAVGGACRHRPELVAQAPSPALWSRDEYCWWTAMRTALPVDSVGNRFSKGFALLGLTEVVSARAGDTVLVRGGPTELHGAHAPGLYAARMVAYAHGDSTRFRWYWSIAPLTARGRAAADSDLAGSSGLPFCHEIGKAVAIQAWAPRDPTAGDSISVWSRVP